MGDRLGLLAFQLPPFLKCDIPRLESFLDALPPAAPSAMEFRHESWFVPEVFASLKRHSVVLCIHDSDAGCTPREITAGAAYVRLRRSAYTAEQREEWRRCFRDWASGGIEVFAYIKHKDNPDAPRIALEFAEVI
jgi:uncharacterized protein YecE (DUF72 family)